MSHRGPTRTAVSRHNPDIACQMVKVLTHRLRCLNLGTPHRRELVTRALPARNPVGLPRPARTAPYAPTAGGAVDHHRVTAVLRPRRTSSHTSYLWVPETSGTDADQVIHRRGCQT